MKLTNRQIKQIIKEELDDLLNKSREFGPYFHKLKDMMTASHEAYNQANELFNQIKGSGMMEPSEEEILQKVSDYASAWYKHRSTQDYLLSLRDFHPTRSSKREEHAQWYRANEEVMAAESAMDRALDELGYDRFSATIMRALKKNNKG
jgi:hypothetical protein|tara:strand:+ start:51 stop:497 length:447 start_codon:yes stop_codon:yes gene_type:complete